MGAIAGDYWALNREGNGHVFQRKLIIIDSLIKATDTHIMKYTMIINCKHWKLKHGRSDNIYFT